MNKFKAIFIVAMLAGVVASPAGADAGGYVGVIYSKIDHSEPGINLNFSTIGGIVGYKLSNSVSVEVRGARAKTHDKLYGVNVELEKTVSILGRLSLPNLTDITPYFLAGYTKGWLKADNGFRVDETDFSYGVGASFSVTNNLGVSVEYLSLFDKDDTEIESFSLLAVWEF